MKKGLREGAHKDRLWCYSEMLDKVQHLVRGTPSDYFFAGAFEGSSAGLMYVMSNGPMPLICTTAGPFEYAK
jgi:hypothetical protein